MTITGTNRNEDIGVLFDIPEGHTISIPTLEVSNVFVPVIVKGKGRLEIEQLITSNFGGDNLNILDSQVYIDSTIVRENTPTRPYNTVALLPGESVYDMVNRLKLDVYDPSLLKVKEYPRGSGRFTVEGYHVDGVAQIFKNIIRSNRADPDAHIRFIELLSIDAELRGQYTQGIMASELNRYGNFKLGTNHLRIKGIAPHRFAMVFNSLDNSIIGNYDDVDMDGKLKIRDVKHSTHTTYNVDVRGIPMDKIEIDSKQVLATLVAVPPKPKRVTQHMSKSTKHTTDVLYESFYNAFRRVIGHEGAYQNIPNDRGNWTGGKKGRGINKGTKYGISAMSYPNLDIKNLTLDEAKAIYKQDYWDKLGLDKLPTCLHFYMFDAAVNSGIGNAARFLQRAVKVVDDGRIGKITLKAVHATGESQLVLAYNGHRLKFMTHISVWRTYGKGWARRIADNMIEGAY